METQNTHISRLISSSRNCFTYINETELNILYLCILHLYLTKHWTFLFQGDEAYYEPTYNMNLPSYCVITWVRLSWLELTAVNRASSVNQAGQLECVPNPCSVFLVFAS